MSAGSGADDGVSLWGPWALAVFVGGLVLATGVGVGVVAYKKSRGIRNKDPLNLRPLTLPEKWQGQVALDLSKGGPFPIFVTPREGWRAGGIDVFGDIIRGQNTIERLIKGTPENNYQDAYAPASDNNDPEDYVRELETSLGIDRSLILGVYLHGPSLLHAISKVENGVDPDLIWGSEPRQQGTQDAYDHLVQRGWL